jgi:hypothetical protein
MKKLLLSLAMAFGAINSGSAADLYVNNSGQSGTYTTIQAAINSASTGDNIYVSPLNSYQESLSITKSIRIASSVAGSRIIVTQDIKISPLANILVELIGIEGMDVTLDTQTSTLGPNSRGRAIITDCSFHDISLDTDYLTLLVVKCSLSGTLTGRHGKVIGNTITEKIMINDEPNIGIGDSIIIQANNVTGNIETKTDDHSVIIQNNKANRILVSNWRAGVTITGLISNNTVISSDVYRYDVNNTYYNTAAGHIKVLSGCINISIAATNQDVSNMLITNNYIDDLASRQKTGSSSSRVSSNWCAVGVSENVPTIYPVVQYNIFDSNGHKTGTSSSYYASWHYGFFSKYWSGAGIYNIQTNIGSSDDAQVISEGKDIGSPSPKFFDADLTRSDIGHVGGNNSWEMFHSSNTVSGAAYIIGLNLPSEIWPGQTINLKAEAVHTN